LSAIAKVQQNDWPSVSKRLAKFFQIENGFWIHKRIENELHRCQSRSEARSKAGKAGVEAKRKQRLSNASALIEQRSTHSQPQSHLLCLERAQSSFAESPGIEEVLFEAQRIGLGEWKARDWFNEMEGCGWLDHAHRPIVAWRAVLSRVKVKWEADGRPSQPPSNPRSQSPKRKPEANQVQEHLEIPRL
jgi:hypothetical protein